MKIATAEEENDNEKHKKKKPAAKKKALSPDEARLELIRAAIGPKGTSKIYNADQKESISDVIPTGMAELDRLFTPNLYDSGVKAGLPRGFVFEFFGPHAGGKSSLCMRLAAQVTKAGGGVFWIDAESSFVREWAEAQGVDLKKVTVCDGGMHGEHYLEIIEKIAKSGAVELIVVDSVTAMQPYEVKFADTDIDEKKHRLSTPPLASAARMLTRFMPPIVSAAKEGNTAVIFINQIRMKVGVVYGNPETTGGGEALKYYSSIRLRVSRVTDKEGRGIKKNGDEIGIRSLVKLVKSRMGPPDREVVVPIYYDQSIKPHPLDSIIDAGLAFKGADGKKLIKSRSKRLESGDTIQTFTFKEVFKDGIDEFKNALEYEDIKEIYEAAKADGVLFDVEVQNYIAELGSDPTESADAGEGDPGA